MVGETHRDTFLTIRCYRRTTGENCKTPRSFGFGIEIELWDIHLFIWERGFAQHWSNLHLPTYLMNDESGDWKSVMSIVEVVAWSAPEVHDRRQNILTHRGYSLFKCGVLFSVLSSNNRCEWMNLLFFSPSPSRPLSFFPSLLYTFILKERSGCLSSLSMLDCPLCSKCFFLLLLSPVANQLSTGREETAWYKYQSEERLFWPLPIT